VHVVNQSYLPSPVPSDRDLWPGELPFTAFGQFGPGQLDLRVFDQDTWWVDRTGAAHLLDEMSDDYLRNVIGFLYERVAEYHAATCCRIACQAAGDVLLGRVNGDLLTLQLGGSTVVDVEPRTWLESTPLLRRLLALSS
jgi:hypothetical protein